MILRHYSDRGDIEVFRPRPPSLYPDAEPLVSAIDEWHSPLYFFPRNCSRIGVWPVGETSEVDRELFPSQTNAKMRLLIDRVHEEMWRTGMVYEYEFDPAGFADWRDHGVWVSRDEV